METELLDLLFRKKWSVYMLKAINIKWDTDGDMEVFNELPSEIIIPTINDYMPMKIGTKGEHVIQVDKHYVEDIGIVKFDLLGVATLNLVKEIKDDLHLNPWDYDINNPEFENDRATCNISTIIQIELKRKTIFYMQFTALLPNRCVVFRLNNSVKYMELLKTYQTSLM